MFKNWEGKTALFTLREFPFLADLQDMTPEEVFLQWKTVIKRGGGIKRATHLVEKARKSVGIKIGIRFAKKEIHSLLDQYDLYQRQ